MLGKKKLLSRRSFLKQATAAGAGAFVPRALAQMGGGGAAVANRHRWLTMSNVPDAGRSDAIAFWTGSQVVTYGGYNNQGGSAYATALIYDPVTAAWESRTISAGVARYYHAGCWTGTQMVVWGGLNNSGSPIATGFVYNPATNTASATIATGAPNARDSHCAVWTGSKMFVWGGRGNGGGVTNTGGLYDPSANSWVTANTSGAPAARFDHSAVLTDAGSVIIWGGGTDSEDFNNGGVFTPNASNGTWSSMITGTGAPSARSYHTAIWTGSKMIVWGGIDGVLDTYFNSGKIYDPVNGWENTISTTNAPSPRAFHRAVWTGSRMIVWGGANNSTLFADGGVYDPVADRWTAIPAIGPGSPPVARMLHNMVWSGKEVYIFNGTNINENQNRPTCGILKY